MGLLSPGGVHSHQDHIAALVKILSAAGLPVFVHAFLDGRDTPPKSARGFLEKFLKDIEGVPGVRLATLSGRYYAMDRDKRWDRVEKAMPRWWMPTRRRFDDALPRWMRPMPKMSPMNSCVPAVLGDYAGMADGDAMLFANFRADRAREISLALLDPGFAGFRTRARGEILRRRRHDGIFRSAEPPDDVAVSARGCARDLGRSDGRTSSRSNCASPRPRNTPMSLSS